MSEDLTEVWREYRAECFVVPGSLVIDIGCSDGYFTDWAVSRGAGVEGFDARRGLAVGPYDGYCTVKGEGFGTYIVPGVGETRMVGLATVLARYSVVDFLKCDIEGGEYLIFDDVDLSNVCAFAMEFHAWTTPDCPVEGLGVKDEPMPAGVFDRLLAKLRCTHDVEIVGDPAAGGYLYGTLKAR
jgi:hypothetical protein